MATRLRAGIVDFLNSRPLAWGFLRGELDERWEAIYAAPARVADMLAAGEVDVGLVPSIEVLRIPGLDIVPGACVAATHEVRSVLLLSRVPLDRIRSVAADSASRTSQALVRILLAEGHGVDATLVPSAPDPRGVPEGFDAALIIGDPALHVRREGYEVIDLARAWRELTGLPFVFAVWAVRRDVKHRGVRADLLASLHSGLAAIDEIVADEARGQGLGAEEVRAYLTSNLRFELGREELAGLREFHRRAAAAGLTDLPLPADAVWRELERSAAEPENSAAPAS